jgi:hypothetical protein
MKTNWIDKGTRSVAITMQDGCVMARLYVNSRETACFQNWKGKTEAGAIRWANKILTA